MKDKLQQLLENECRIQIWVRNHLSKPIEEKKVINKLCISSVKQRIML